MRLPNRNFGLFVVGVDGSPQGTHAQEVAAELARRCGARVMPVSADGAARVPDESHRVPGIPGIELPRYAESVGADLLILGRRPRDGMSPPLGATGDAVVRRSRVPCLLVPEHVPVPRAILLALDPGPRGGTVRDFATAFARAAGIELRCVSVKRVPGAPRGSGPSTTDPKSFCDDAGHCLRRWREGELSTEILAEAEDVGADAIAFGVHRGGRLGAASQLGVSHHLVREARTALLTVPL
jgi:nucleotide-binding universal stress UspA family protein